MHGDQAEAEPSDDPEDLFGLATAGSIQAALLAADEPITPAKLAQLTGAAGPGAVRRLVGEINAGLQEAGRAFYVAEVAGGYQMQTRPAFARWLRKLHASRNELRLSPAAMETLAIVAYRQPVLRADIEEIRGVQAGEMLRQLLERGLARIVGRDDSLGRPILYGTTKAFLRHFGLRHLDDLPRATELRLPFGAGDDSQSSDEAEPDAEDDEQQEEPLDGV